LITDSQYDTIWSYWLKFTHIGDIPLREAVKRLGLHKNTKQEVGR
jgi:hypothetical protein